MESLDIIKFETVMKKSSFFLLVFYAICVPLHSQTKYEVRTVSYGGAKRGSVTYNI